MTEQSIVDQVVLSFVHFFSKVGAKIYSNISLGSVVMAILCIAIFAYVFVSKNDNRFSSPVPGNKVPVGVPRAQPVSPQMTKVE